ncbi:MAG: hypothetical protein HFI78_12535 [Lachnospiraceae bacterium]|jgi:hypothetical protein|nr:hypothetical protein [Lachnospiraceae bacterium]
MKKKFLQKLLPCALSTAIAFSMAPVPLYADSLPPVITSDYGNPSVPQSIPGNVQVTGSNITVQNTGIQGDLNITEGGGTVTFHGVSTTGSGNISGKGGQNLRFQDCTIPQMNVARDDSIVWITGNSTVPSIGVSGRCIIDATSKTNSSPIDVTIGPNTPPGTMVGLCGNLGSVTIDAKDVRVGHTAGSVASVSVTRNGGGSRVLVFPNSSISSMKADAPVTIDNFGSLAQLEVNSSGVSINNPAARTISSAAPSSQEGSSGSSGSSDSSQNDSNTILNESTGGNKPENPSPSEEQIEIVGIYPSLAKVTVELSHPVKLETSNFYISCPRGQDMTILNSITPDGPDKNRIYHLSTSYYKDNTYVLSITLPSGKVLEKTFATNLDVPQITNAQASRMDGSTAKFSFVSDTFGSIYYMVVPEQNSKARSVIGSQAPTTPEEIKEKGMTADIHANVNELTIPGLQSGTAYTLYYAIARKDGQNPIMGRPLPISAVPEQTSPDTAEIKIEEAKPLSDDRIFIKFNKPTPVKLDISAFYVKCPAQAALKLGRAETSDLQSYVLYMETGWHFLSGNHYDVKVTFPDSTVATGRFYADLDWPTITLFDVYRLSDTSIQVTFTSNESGVLHYGTAVSYEDFISIPTSQIRQTGIERPLNAGKNDFVIDVPAGHSYFYMVAEDTLGNYADYKEWKQIPTTITQPEEKPDFNEITDITVTWGTEWGTGRPAQKLLVQFKEPYDEKYVGDLQSRSSIQIIQSQMTKPPRIQETSYHDSDPSKYLRMVTMTVNSSTTLTEGTYKLIIEFDEGTLEKEFHISADSGSSSSSASYTVSSNSANK